MCSSSKYATFWEIRGLPLLTLPPVVVRGKHFPVHRAVDGGTEVSGRDLLEDVCRHRPVRVEVRLDVPRRPRDPRSQDDGIEQGDSPEPAAVEKVRAKDDRAADVVARQRGLLEAPMVEELDEETRVACNRDLGFRSRGRVAVPGQVEHVDGEAAAESRDDVSPEIRPAGRPVHEDGGGSLAEDVVRDLSLGEAGAAAEAPAVRAVRAGRHGRPSCYVCSAITRRDP